MPSSVKHVRKANRNLVLNSVIKKGKQTIGDIIRMTGLSRPTVVTIINELINDEILIKSGLAPADVGRQSTLFSVNASFYVAIGIDLDFPPIRMTIVDLAGTQIYNESWDMPPDSDVMNVAKSIMDHITQALASLKIGKKNCLGIGLGVPSIQNDTRSGRKISVARIHDWKSLNIGEYIQNKLNIKVFLRNDAQLIGMYENALLNDSSESFLFVLWRWGIGMAIFINGKLYEGTFGNGGQISHMVIDVFSENECYCGNHGCLELYASKKAILQVFNKKNKTNSINDIDDIFNMGEQNQSEAVEILEQAGKALGTALAAAIKMLDIPKVIISGINCSEKNPFWKSMKLIVQRNTAHSLLEEPQILKSTLSDTTYGMGGCFYVLKNYFNIQLQSHAVEKV
jgi:predicted NBD/HSP70 family sugar kinase